MSNINHSFRGGSLQNNIQVNGKDIISCTKDKTRLAIISENSGRAQREALSREINLRFLIKNHEEYEIEKAQKKHKSSNGRTDAVLYQDIKNENNANEKKLIHLIEFKDTQNGDFESKLEEAKTQIDDYVKKLEIPKEGLYVSISINNIEKLLEDPKNILLYLEENEFNKKHNSKKVFEKYGIFILTKKIESKKGNIICYEKEVEFISKDKEHFDFPNFMKVSTLSSDPVFNTKNTFAKFEEAFFIPTISKIGGVQNVRDIKDMNDSDKSDQIYSIYESFLKEGYHKKNYFWAEKEGKEKDFNYIINETIVYPYLVPDEMQSIANKVFTDINNILNDEQAKNLFTSEKTDKMKKDIESFLERSKKELNNRFTLATLNGGLIDGQNSVDSLKKIYLFLNDELPLDNNVVKKLIEINKKHSKGVDKESLIEFFKKCYVPVKMGASTENDNAQDTAHHKNNTMTVTKDEIFMTKNVSSIKELSRSVLIESDTNLHYPKKPTDIIEDICNFERVDFIDIAKAFYVVNERVVPQFKKKLIKLKKENLETSLLQNEINKFLAYGISKDYKNKLKTPDGRTNPVKITCDYFIKKESLEDNEDINDLIEHKSFLLDKLQSELNHNDLNDSDEVNDVLLQQKNNISKYQYEEINNRLLKLREIEEKILLGNYEKFEIKNYVYFEYILNIFTTTRKIVREVFSSKDENNYRFFTKDEARGIKNNLNKASLKKEQSIFYWILAISFCSLLENIILFSEGKGEKDDNFEETIIENIKCFANNIGLANSDGGVLGFMNSLTESGKDDEGNDSLYNSVGVKIFNLKSYNLHEINV